MKISAEETSREINLEEVVSPAGAVEAEEIVDGVVEEAEGIEVEGEDAVVPRGTPQKISKKRLLLPQCRGKRAWGMLRVLKTRSR